jgi:hypothetical protein
MILGFLIDTKICAAQIASENTKGSLLTCWRVGKVGKISSISDGRSLWSNSAEELLTVLDGL